jgi:hypothetical protein
MPDEATLDVAIKVEEYVSLALSFSKLAKCRCRLQFLRPQDPNLVAKARANLDVQDRRKNGEMLVLGVFVGSRNRYSVLFCRRGASEARQKKEGVRLDVPQTLPPQLQQQKPLQSQQAPPPPPQQQQQHHHAAPVVPPLPPFLRPAVVDERLSDSAWNSLFSKRGFTQAEATLAIQDIKKLFRLLGPGSILAGSFVTALADLSKRFNFADLDF